MKENDKIIPLDRGNKNQRSKFHKYISIVFPGISFKEWYSKGFWTEKYLPFSIYESGKIVSNVSITFMDIILNDTKVKSIQFGAVGTLPEYRHQGLSRQIMNFVIEKYMNYVDFFFLYSNESTIEFYRKFGFREIKENIFLAKSNIIKSKSAARKLDISLDTDYLLLQNILNNRWALTRIFGAEKYAFITMWHILNLYRDKLYYLEKERIVVIKEEENNTLCIIDVLFSESIELQSLLPKIIVSDSIQCVKYYFPPDIVKFSCDKILQDETGLFILGDIDLGKKPFRFSNTAIT
jgi:hypothetical protein